MFSNVDTITAIATPPGRGGIGVVRVSGPKVKEITKKILGKLLKPRYATYSNFLADKKTCIDYGIAIYFPAPNSFTGEDVLELHGHGGPIVLDKILQRLIALGARLARPGEFSERAFLNDKIDLLQAEAIADLINASSKQAANNAMRSLRGEFSSLIASIDSLVTTLRAQVELNIDFTEEDYEVISSSKINDFLMQILRAIETTKASAKQGLLLKEGINLAIVGKPNVGKSTLMNILCGQDCAIVTDIPGTTRDVLRAEILIDGLPVHLLDTAGLHASEDIIELEGMKRAREEMAQVDKILLVVDSSVEKNKKAKEIIAELIVPEFADKVTIIYNKIDLVTSDTAINVADDIPTIFLSAKTGKGIDSLKQHIKDLVDLAPTEGNFSARRRHLDALERAKMHIEAAISCLAQNSNFEILAEELRLTHIILGEITGQFSSEDLLTKIFSEFCIGK